MKKNTYYFITTFIYQLIMWAIYVPLLFALKRNGQSILYTFLIPLAGFLLYCTYATKSMKIKNFVLHDIKTYFLLPITISILFNVVFTLFHYIVFGYLYSTEYIVILLVWPIINIFLFSAAIAITNIHTNQYLINTEITSIVLCFILNTFNWGVYFLIEYVFEKTLFLPLYLFAIPLLTSIFYCIFFSKKFAVIDSFRDYIIQIVFSIIYNLIVCIFSIHIVDYLTPDRSFFDFTGIMEIIFAIINCFLICFNLIVLGYINKD